jgi:acyl-CoA synthetase (AMP-forming)/AMP-acid ligase II
MTAPDSIPSLLAAGRSDATAISGPSVQPSTYDDLRAQVAETVETLNSVGVGRGDRVAYVLPNGACAATAFLGVAAGATAAPLNPAYRADELDFYLSDLGAKALVVAAGLDTPAPEVAARLGIPTIRLTPEDDRGAGRYRLELTAQMQPAAPRRGGFGEGDEIALVLHTSGTTSRPKIVPLAYRNTCASARNVAATLRLTSTDTGLVIMPLFHIHGLIAAISAPLSVGGRVFCTPGFNALRFFAWMQEARPTWYTAVPTMHQAILSRADRNRDVIAANPLRFLRSSSASLAPKLLAELESAFNAPVIEAYGMTEAAHQMASNPLPPGDRRAGSVGLAAGPEVAIMGTDGQLLAPGETGEVVIRGANVTSGYENNPDANRGAFTNGWFRTGDQGVMNADGYLALTGRLKEIINRGGEKVSPREVDEALLDHPAVHQAVAFAIPHDKLGEEVGAAIVLRDGIEATERELKEFVQSRLADFKVPRRIVFVAEIPKGATGKLQRIGLAEKLGVTS